MASPAIKLLAAAGGGGIGEPPVVASQVACWWADDLVGVVADTDPVSSWVDRTSSFDATASSTVRPTFNLDGVGGGKPSVDFDGTNDVLTYSGILTSATQGCVIMVCAPVSLPTSSVNDTYWGAGDVASGNRYLQAGPYNVSGTTRMFLDQFNSTGEDFPRSTTDAMSAGTDYVMEWSSSGTAYSMRLNNNSQSLSFVVGSDTGDWFGDVSNVDNFTIGALVISSTTNYSPVRVSLLLVADAELSAGDRTALYDWINAYYGI
jgi:hypothetical protein